MLHRTVRTFQRAALRQSSARQHGHIYGFRSQPGPLYTITRSLYDDSDVLPSSQNSYQAPSQAPSYQSWSVDKINVLQPDMTTTKLQPGYLKSTNTKISNLQGNLQTGLARQFSAPDYKSDFKINTFESKFDSKFNTLESKFDSKFNTLESKFDSKLDILERRLKHNIVELMVELKWQLFFAAQGVTVVVVGGIGFFCILDS